MKKLILSFTLILSFLYISAQCADRSCIWDAFNNNGIMVFAKFCPENSANLPRVLVEVSNYNKKIDYKITYTIRWFNKNGEIVRTENCSLHVDRDTYNYDAGFNYYPSSQPAYSYGSYRIYDLTAKSHW